MWKTSFDRQLLVIQCVLMLSLCLAYQHEFNSQSLSVYTVIISTTDTTVLKNAPSRVPFRLTVTGERGESARYVAGGAEQRDTYIVSIANKDLGTLYEASIYTTNMSDPWHVKMLIVKEHKTQREYCFLFDKWIGWKNTIVWRGCQSGDCACHWPEMMSYTIMLVGPFGASLKVRISGTRRESETIIKSAEDADSWEIPYLPHIGDIQKITITCNTMIQNGPRKLNRILIAAGNDRHFHCFKFEQDLCDPAIQSTHSAEKECENVHCYCP